jgi:hypothetical protein
VSADLTEVYAALQKADAAGDTAGAKQLADYIRSQGTPAIKATSLDYDPTTGQMNPTGSAAAHAAQSPVYGSSFGQNMVEGLGKSYTDIALGAQQIYGSIADKISPQSPNLSGLITGQQPSRTAALQQEATDKRALDSPLSHTWGAKAGAVAGAAPLALIPGAGTLVGAGLIGGGMGALNPTTANDSRLFNTTLGAGTGVLTQAAGNVLGKWLTSRNTGLNPTQQQAAQAGTDLGMQLTPGQQSGNKALQQMEAKLESQPWTSGPFNQLKASNQEVGNQVVANAIGENSKVVDASTLGAANDRLGQVFESVRSPTTSIQTNPTATTTIIDKIDQDMQGLIPGSIRDNALVARFESIANQGSATGEQLGSLSSKLGKAAYKNMTTQAGDRDLGQALYQVKDHVDDLLQSSLSPDAAAGYATARQQYRTLMQLTSRLGVVNPSSGNVSLPTLANRLQQSDKGGFLYGRNQSDLYNVARFGKAFQPVVGDSGTATRSWNIADLPLGIPANLAARAYLSAPGAAIARGLVGATPPTAVGKAIAPIIQSGLPGIGGASLVPYLTQ